MMPTLKMSDAVTGKAADGTYVPKAGDVIAFSPPNERSRVIAPPEKRKVGGSTPPLSTVAEQHERPEPITAGAFLVLVDGGAADRVGRPIRGPRRSVERNDRMTPGHSRVARASLLNECAGALDFDDEALNDRGARGRLYGGRCRLSGFCRFFGVNRWVYR
ncbi:hypothetical protein GCM10009525_52300 [Streptosporangium amethystogenes subsp. fukuiense]